MEICSVDALWTTQSQLLTSAETLIREIDIDTSLSTVLESLQSQPLWSSDRAVVCGFDPLNGADRLTFADREVDGIFVSRKDRRVDLRWVERRSPPRWLSLPENVVKLAKFRSRRADNARALFVGQDGVNVSGLDGEGAVHVFGMTYLL